MKTTILSLLLATLAAGPAAAATISDILVRQQWPWAGTVGISYVLSDAGNSGYAHNVQVDAYQGDTKICTIPANVLSGDTFPTTNGVKHLYFDPSAVDELKGLGVIPQFKVSLTTSGEVLYMVVDLTKNAGESGQITYLTAYDITNNASTYGSWEWGNTFHTGTYLATNWQNTIVWTGVTNNPQYASNNIVLRYIPSGTFMMGCPANEVAVSGAQSLHSVTFTKPFFAGVFPVTQGQYKWITNLSPSGNTCPGLTSGTASWKRDLLPVENVSYDDLRGCWTNEAGASQYNWPTNGHAVASDSCVGILRAKTGLAFDLPTEAQWEYACRAGTTGTWNNATTLLAVSGDAYAYPDANMGNLGWYGYALINRTTYPVGMKQPNGWGLYDMHGNVSEWCLDWFNYYTSEKEDPAGASSSISADSVRSNRGGNYITSSNMVYECKSSARGRNNCHTPNPAIGFRLCCQLSE